MNFLQYLNELRFSDLKPAANQWTSIPSGAIAKSTREPDPGLDDELFQLIAKSYAYVGGYPDFKRAEDLPANHTVWYGIDVDGDRGPDAVIFGKNTNHGTKWTGGASNGTPEAKRAVVDAFVKRLTTRGNYVEASDAIMHILITRYHVPVVTSHAQVEKILGKPVQWLGAHPNGLYPGYSGFYTRNLFGDNHMKILLGQPR